MIQSRNNSRPFSSVCHNRYGRQVIYSNADKIDESNIVLELEKARTIFWKNREEIEYLDDYYRGNQPILYRVKPVRPEINNKIVENHAFEIVEHKVAEMFGEPVQYVLNGNDESKSEHIKLLNDHMSYDDKGFCDTEIGRWRSICGTSYRFLWVNKNPEDDEPPFRITSESPLDTFVVYSSKEGHDPLFSCQIRKDVENKPEYFIYTRNMYYRIKEKKITQLGVNGIGYIPVIEYPNNERRMSDIELTITLTDSINNMQSNRVDGIEQFIQAFILFVNCEIDSEKFMELAQKGAISIKTTNPAMQASAQSIASQLEQGDSQVSKDDLYSNMLIIQGMPDRQENSGGDTGQAVVLRNGFYFSEKRAELNEPVFKKSERQFLKAVLNIYKTTQKLDLKLTDIEIKVTRSKMDNMQVKAQVLQMLLNCGVEYSRAIKTVNLWSDPEQVCIESRPYMEAKFSPAAAGQQTQNGGDGNVTAI